MHTYTCALRWSDLDAQGHVNNALLLNYLQEARVDFLVHGGVDSLLAGGVVVTSHQVEYRKPISYRDDGVQIRMSTGKVGASRFQVIYDVIQGEDRVAHARSELCAFDFGTDRPARLDAATRAYLTGQRADWKPMQELKPDPLNGAGQEVEIPVRWTDLDRYQHVNNAVVFDYLQQARIALFAQSSEFMWLVARQDVDYLRQIAHGTVSVRCAPTRIGRTSITLTTEVYQSSLLCARGGTVLVCADRDGAPLPVPEATRDALNDLLPGTGG